MAGVTVERVVIVDPPVEWKAKDTVDSIRQFFPMPTFGFFTTA
jgi:hypothetical protein